jgi:L-arabinonolactonase
MQEEIDLSALLHGKTVVPSASDFVTARLIIDCHCELGEGIIFDDRKHALLWTDILERRFHKLQLNYSEPTKVVFSTYELPKKLCSFGMLEQESETLPLLCAFEDAFQLYDPEQQKSLSEESKGEDVNPEKGATRMNDGRVEPQGNRFISGGHYGGQLGTEMKVFRCEQKEDGSLVHEPILENVATSNSICWNLDGSVMYFADSPTKLILAYKYDSNTGTLSSKKLLHEQKVDEHSVPDGSCVDSEGFIWNAVWRAGAAPGMIQRIDPDSGQVVFTVHMPDTTSQVTCCCFGGENLDILFITTAAEWRDRRKEPHAGGLYAVRLPFQGRKESRLKFKI